MKKMPLIVLIAIAVLAVRASAEDGAWKSGYDQWKEAMSQADSRVAAIDARSGHAAQTARDALSRAEQSRYDIEKLASSLRDRDSEIDSAKFKAKVAKDEFDSAKMDADQADQQMEKKATDLNNDFARLRGQSNDLDTRDANLKTELARLQNWSAQIESRRRVFRVPDEQAALDAFNADVANYNAARDQYENTRTTYNTDINKWNDWRGQLLEIQKLITEDGRHVLQLRQVESTKERDYSEAQQKLEKLTSEQDSETSQLAALIGPSFGALQGLVGALDSPPPPVHMNWNNPGQYVRSNDATAQAVSLPPVANSDATPANRLRDRIFVLPPSDATTPDEARNRLAGAEVSADLAADDLAKQYHPTTIGNASDSGATPVGDAGSAVKSLPTVSSTDSDKVLPMRDSDVVPALDPRRFISRDEYESALAARDRLNNLLPKLEAELEKVRGQREKTLDYEGEFEEIRAENARGALRDALSVIPVPDLLKKLAANPQLAEKLTPQVIAEVDLAMKAVRMEIGREQASQVKESAEQRKQQIEVIRQGAEALLSVCTNELPEAGSSRMMLEQMGHMLQTYYKFSDYLNDPKSGTRPPWEEAGEIAKVGIGVAGVFCAPVALGAGIESLGERAATKVIIKSAMDDLSDSLKHNYDAERFLTEKIERTRGFVTELDRTVDGYQAVHGAPQPPHSGPQETPAATPDNSQPTPAPQ